ncbi:positive regulator of sigma(E), RseC/MucC superfamily [Leadbettera azotonutricia ZAS-9]|uniref:Positive regulator of sigma(E), RseC/MucC superfamily n=2 Tax=Leadbettera azotonutricia TaxID=150829 RepID=F5Y951_LEAAZ|nr:positive regulator of sigma(E), RseC/MucC superfamily [Leadbettera azotonutricia ZAS-9]
MIETGRISAIAGSTITVQQDAFSSFKNSEACFGCMNQECKEKQGYISVSNPLKLPLEIGSQVETEISPKMILGQAFFALIPPLAGFIAGFLLAGLIFPSIGDPGKAFGGVILMFAGAFGFYFYRKRHPVKVLPRVVRILPQ